MMKKLRARDRSLVLYVSVCTYVFPQQDDLSEIPVKY